MTSDRFAFQRHCVEQTTGKVLNAGCKEDPAHLKENFSDRVTNLDLRDYDDGVWHSSGFTQKVPIPVDVMHDMTVFPWPFEDNTFDLVVLGDVLEDLPDDGCQLSILREVARISTHVCITTPEDTPERDWHHLTTITEERIKAWLTQAGFDILALDVVDYGFVPRGYFVYAKRYEDAKPKRTSKRSI